MNNKGKNVYINVALILGVFATTSCSNQLTAKSNSDNLIDENSKIVKDDKNTPSLYRNLRDINGGNILVFHFNLNSVQAHPNQTNNRNNAKNTIITEHTIQADNHQLAIKRLPHRN